MMMNLAFPMDIDYWFFLKSTYLIIKLSFTHQILISLHCPYDIRNNDANIKYSSPSFSLLLINRNHFNTYIIYCFNYIKIGSLKTTGPYFRIALSKLLVIAAHVNITRSNICVYCLNNKSFTIYVSCFFNAFSLSKHIICNIHVFTNCPTSVKYVFILYLRIIKSHSIINSICSTHMSSTMNHIYVFLSDHITIYMYIWDYFVFVLLCHIVFTPGFHPSIEYLDTTRVLMTNGLHYYYYEYNVTIMNGNTIFTYLGYTNTIMYNHIFVNTKYKFVSRCIYGNHYKSNHLVSITNSFEIHVYYIPRINVIYMLIYDMHNATQTCTIGPVTNMHNIFCGILLNISDTFFIHRTNIFKYQMDTKCVVNYTSLLLIYSSFLVKQNVCKDLLLLLLLYYIFNLSYCMKCLFCLRFALTHIPMASMMYKNEIVFTYACICSLLIHVHISTYTYTCDFNSVSLVYVPFYYAHVCFDEPCSQSSNSSHLHGEEKSLGVGAVLFMYFVYPP